MPYIKQSQREIIDEALQEVKLALIECTAEGEEDGVLNYCFTKLLDYCFKTRDGLAGNYQYGQRAFIGILECCKLEWCRRRLAPYEDIKINENGDV